MNKENVNLARYLYTFLSDRNKTISVMECDYLAEKIIGSIKNKIKEEIKTLEKIDDKQEVLNSLMSKIGDIEYFKICVPCGGEGYTSQYHSYPCHECKSKGFKEE
mgnify:CR=1 FL=1|tara:strand:+ start:2344 stop:2658 length:315 start_codon:yes stop_codon:yes gene_type:complete